MNMLIIGYGNPGRLDDGLGPAFAERMAEANLPGVIVESDYQLNIEDAALITGHDLVVFADASVNAVEPFAFETITACEPMVGFSSHSITAESLLGLADQLFEARPRAFAMAIRGYEFNEFGERLSEQAQQNLAAAVAFFRQWAEAAG